MDKAAFFASDEEAQRAYIAFGRIAINWGPVENILEDMLILLRLRRGINRMKGFPSSFSAVSDELAKRWEAEDLFAEHLDALKGLLGEVRDLHEIRVNVVHGTCQGTNLDGLVMFGKSKRREGWAYKARNFHFDEIEAAADRMIGIMADFQPLWAFTRQNWQRNADGTPFHWHRPQGIAP